MSQTAGLAALFVAFSCQGLQNAIANGDTRSLAMHHMHTGEDVDIVYKRNGKYDDDALEKINWFLRDWRKQEKTRMDPHVLDVIWEVYRDTGGSEPIQIVCGYRSPGTNAMLRRRSKGVARFSQHTLGKAVDFYIPGVALDQLRYAGLRLQRGGVGYYPTSGSPFVHLDTGNVRHWPRMSPELLARVLRDKPTMVAARSRKPATDRTVVADAEKPKRSFLAKLFGFGEEGDDEDAAEAAPSKAPVAVANHREPAKPAQVTATAAVPVPAVRPARAARSGGFDLASASSTPVKLASAPAQPSPADVINSRVDWRGQINPEPETVAQNTPPPAAVGPGGARLQWVVGPPGRPVAKEPPRPPAEIASATPAQDTTAGLGDWPNNIRRDRAPGQLALAYAAVTPSSETRTRSLGAIRPAVAEPARSLKPGAAAAPAPPPGSAWSSVQKSAPRIQDPWLRAIVMAPSAYYSMRVALLGPADFRSLTTLMRKPPSAVAMVFTVDPYFGLTSEAFAGSAVSFVPTITFSTRTAALN